MGLAAGPRALEIADEPLARQLLAAQTEGQGQETPGITLEQLMRAFDQQVRSIVSQLREQTVANYTDLPDGVRVASLRRIPQPAHLPIEFQRP